MADEAWRILRSELHPLPRPELGKGAFGEVRLYRWRRTDVAVKSLHCALPCHAALFAREFDVFTRLHHPNIVQLLGYVETPFCIVMEFLAGGSLADRAHRLSRAQKRRVCLDVLRALVYMHNRRPEKVMHRDIKPGNILFTRSGAAKLADLGLSKLIVAASGDDLASLGSAAAAWRGEHSRSVGSERYAAPESRGQDCALLGPSTYTEAVDIYSLGVVAYELFEKARFDCSTRAAPVVEWALTPHPERRVLASMLRPDPAERSDACTAYDAFEAITRPSAARRFRGGGARALRALQQTRRLLRPPPGPPQR